MEHPVYYNCATYAYQHMFYPYNYMNLPLVPFLQLVALPFVIKLLPSLPESRLVFDSPVIESIGLNQTKFVESKRFDSPSGLFDSQAVIESNALEIKVD